ncbi:hypothetical protein KI387_036931, partial [Taxus chinensis]
LVSMTSNRHWPNLFKVKPSAPQHQWHQITASTNISTQNSSSNEGSQSQEEERNPDPKPRWNPKAEQIRILESIFNSGMVNPPREEIQKIRMQLQEYGQVGDANVFYWFQNRKSRTKQKQRHLQACADKAKSAQKPSSSLIDQYNNTGSNGGSELSSSASFSMHYVGHGHEQGFSGRSDEYPNHLWNEGGISSYPVNVNVNANISPTFPMNEPHAYPLYLDQVRAAENFNSNQNLLPSTLNDSSVIHRATESGMNNCNATLYSSVFINDVPFDAPMGPINVKALFGENAFLVHSSGQPVLVDEQGFTLHGLQGGAMYYL